LAIGLLSTICPCLWYHSVDFYKIACGVGVTLCFIYSFLIVPLFGLLKVPLFYVDIFGGLRQLFGIRETFSYIGGISSWRGYCSGGFNTGFGQLGPPVAFFADHLFVGRASFGGGSDLHPF